MSSKSILENRSALSTTNCAIIRQQNGVPVLDLKGQGVINVEVIEQELDDANQKSGHSVSCNITNAEEDSAQLQRLFNPSVELFAQELKDTPGLDLFLSAVTKAVCTWLSKTWPIKFRFLNSYGAWQTVKARLFHKILASLADVTEYLLSQRQRIQKSCYKTHGLWFLLKRYRVNATCSSEVLVIPAHSYVFKAVLKDVHNRYHGSAPVFPKCEVLQNFHPIPDITEKQLALLRNMCPKCKLRVQLLQPHRKRPPSSLPIAQEPSGIVLMSRISFDSCGTMLVKPGKGVKKNI